MFCLSGVCMASIFSYLQWTRDQKRRRGAAGNKAAWNPLIPTTAEQRLWVLGQLNMAFVLISERTEKCARQSNLWSRPNTGENDSIPSWVTRCKNSRVLHKKNLGLRSCVQIPALSITHEWLWNSIHSQNGFFSSKSVIYYTVATLILVTVMWGSLQMLDTWSVLANCHLTPSEDITQRWEDVCSSCLQGSAPWAWARSSVPALTNNVNTGSVAGEIYQHIPGLTHGDICITQS